MATTLNINNLHFGSDDAELDEQHDFLDRVFLKTSIYHRVKEQQRELVIGRKGSGKSAMYLMLKKALESEGITTIPVTPEILSSQGPEQNKGWSFNNDPYSFAWKHALLLKISLELYHKVRKSKHRRKLRKAIKNIRKVLSINSEIEKNMRERSLYGLGFLPRLFSKVSLKVLGIEGSIETRQIEEQKRATKELEKLVSNIKNIQEALGKIQIVVLIDKVDEIWDSTNDSKMSIVGLIKASHDLHSKVPNTHSVLFLRSDIYDVLKFHDSDKFHTLEERLKWDEEDLKFLIATRGKVSAELEISDPNVIWNTIFELHVNGELSFQYILKRTMMRPRELIQFCNEAVGKAQDRNHDHIYKEDILDAERQYSSWKLKDLASEYQVQHPYLEVLLDFFKSSNATFSLAEFNSKFQLIQPVLANRFPTINDINPGQMLQILFDIGFLGARRDNRNLFVFDDTSIILSQYRHMAIHPAFNLALGLQNT